MRTKCYTIFYCKTEHSFDHFFSRISAGLRLEGATRSSDVSGEISLAGHLQQSNQSWRGQPTKGKIRQKFCGSVLQTTSYKDCNQSSDIYCDQYPSEHSEYPSELYSDQYPSEYSEYPSEYSQEATRVQEAGQYSKRPPQSLG